MAKLRKSGRRDARTPKRWDEILKRLPIGKCVMVEVGVWRGVNALEIMARHSNVTIHCVDRWQASEYGDAYHLTGSKDASINQIEFDKVRVATLDKLHYYQSRAIVHHMSSVAASRQFRDAYADLVFIDADHSHLGCQGDIIAWLPKVKPGGWLGGHDYGHERFPGVEQAVKEAFPNWRECIVNGADHTWWYRCA